MEELSCHSVHGKVVLVVGFRSSSSVYGSLCRTDIAAFPAHLIDYLLTQVPLIAWSMLGHCGVQRAHQKQIRQDKS
jgi:hypothetical protein